MPKDNPPLDLMAAIRAMYPHATAEQLKASLTPEFLTQAYGEVPEYSDLSAPQIHNVKTQTAGSCVICYGYDTAATASREPLVAIITRAETGPQGEPRYGVLGGYHNLGTETTAGEQPEEGAARETREESVNAKGKSVIAPALGRMQLLTTGVDYSTPALPVGYDCYTLKLNTQEMSALKIHSQKLENDADYRHAVFEKSHREVRGIKLMPLSQALALPRESFFHPHEYDVLETFAEKLKLRGQIR